MHTIYDTVAKSGRNDLFESHVRLKTIGSASRYRVLIVVNSITMQAKFESCIGGLCYSLPKKPPKNHDLYFVYFLQETDCKNMEQ